MNANDFRRIALSLPGAEESSHMGSPDFRVGGRIFATLASQDKGYGNLMLNPDQQTRFDQMLKQQGPGHPRESRRPGPRVTNAPKAEVPAAQTEKKE